MNAINQQKISRRTAIKLGAGLLGGAALGLWRREDILAFFRADKEKGSLSQVERRAYHGKATLPLLGFGAMRLPTSEGRIDEELAEEMVDYAYRHGANYFDTAYMYHGGESETFLGRVLKKYPRESYVLADKMPGFKLKGPAEAREVFEEQLARCQTDYFDNYFLHYLNDEESFRRFYLEGGILSYLHEEKSRGRIRNLGFSFHGDVPFLQKLVEGWEWDCVLIQLNYLDWNEEGVAPEGSVDKGSQYRLLAAHHLPVIVMEPLKGGKLANLPRRAGELLKSKDAEHSQASWGMRFAGGQPQVVTILSGMSSLEQVVDNINTFSDFQPLSGAQLETLREVREHILASQAVGCTACRYCMPCPYGVDIAGNFQVYNNWAGELGLLADPESVTPQAKAAFLKHYQNAVEKSGRADMCIRCHKCEPLCPQHIKIPAQLQKVEQLVNLCQKGMQGQKGALI